MNIARIAVIGAGTMGTGIAQVAAQGGYRVTLCDTNHRLVEQAIAAIGTSFDKGIGLGKMTAERKGRILARIEGADLRHAAGEADLIVEAIPEKLVLKEAFYKTLAHYAQAHCIFASNTSSLSIAKLADASGRPDRFLGMHFFNPVPRMKLLEIVVTDATSPETLAACRAVGEKMRKDCIVVKDSPGFATSRLGVCLGLEAIRMFEQGVARAEDIDKAMTLGYAHAMGPLRLTDLVGLDVRLAIADYLHAELGSEVFKAPALMRKMVEEGQLGKKSGEGFYKW
jgi:3-hydroxybutyryl-CoA dehydrogenase